MRTVVEIIGRFDSLSNSSKSFEKAIDIKRKKKSFHVQRAFLYIHLQRLYEATTTEIFIMRRFNMWDDIKQNIIFFLFLNLGAVPRIHLQANSHTFDMNLSELEYDEYTRHSLKNTRVYF